MTTALSALTTHKPNGILYYNDVVQGSDEWLAVRLGLLTASEVKKIVTPATLKLADNETVRSHLRELAGQRITQYVEPSYISDDMLRGMNDEGDARSIYNDNFGQVLMTGFMTNDKWGFTLGYSPDGLVGDDGQIEIKCRLQKIQLHTIMERKVPTENIIQIQTGLTVSERKWCDYVSHCPGLPMIPLRVYPDDKLQNAIIEASGEFYQRLEKFIADYHAVIADKSIRLIPTVRREEGEMIYG